ncbi:MAG: nickel-dependent lactate racemase [Acidobacteria bacterium]|nr:nickel-dependent lactate racemase [Acidobacteriota bacterium]
MNLSLKYNRTEIELNLPAARFQLLLPPIGGRAGESDPLREGRCFDEPVQRPPLHEFLENKRRILLVVSDATRRTGSAEVVSELAKYFIKYDIKYEEFNIIVATGIHRPPTESEIPALLGEQWPARARLLAYRAEDESHLVYVGRTSFENRIYLHHSLIHADAVLICGGVGFHYFAGFSGGRKSILPGLAGLESLSANHNLIFHGAEEGRHPRATTASLNGNPVHEDMMEAMELFGTDQIFLINTLFSADGTRSDIICGHPVHSHREACRRYLDGHSVVIPRPADLVVASAGGFPRDINMIQSHKAIEMARYALRPGGTLIMLAACQEGMGHPAFFPWFRFETEAEFRRELRRNYVVNGQTALALFEKSRRYRIYLASELDPAAVRQMGMQPLPPAASAIQALLEGEFRAAVGYVLPEAATTFCQPADARIERP